MRAPLILATAAAALVAAAPATAAPALQQTLSAASAVTRSDCATTRLVGRPGVASASWTAPVASSFAAHLAGPGSSDWDLAVFDATSGRRLGGSAGWGADELVTGSAAAGHRLELQACRVSGAAASVPLTLTAAPLPKAPAPRAQLVRIALGSPAALRRVQGLGLDLDESTDLGSIDAVVTDPADLQRLARNGFSAQVVVSDLAAYDRAQQRRTDAYSRSVGAAGSPLPSGRSDYRMPEDYPAELKKLAQQYPAIVRGVTLPHKTYQGRQVTGIEISSDVARPDDQKPTAFIMGVHHAREWPSGEAAMEFAYYLVQGFGSDPDVTDLLQRSRVVVVPIVNPDGFTSSRTAQDPADQSGDPGGAPSLGESVGAGGSLAYRRKNCSSPLPPQTPCDVANGVDPNRNYGFNWGGPGASTTPTSQSYRGPGPWSELETQNVHEFSQVHDVTALMTLHNFASLVLRPPALHNGGLAPDEDRLKALGDAMGSDTGYTSQYSYQLYDTSGTTEDWNYGAAGTFGYTIEMGPEAGDGGNFHVSYDRGVVDQWTGTGNRAGRGLRKALMRIAQESAVRGDFSTLIGRAPAGRILRLHKSFSTSTAPICQIASPSDVDVASLAGQDDSCESPTDPMSLADKLDYTTRVPANGIFDWIVTPSTRPFVYKGGGREAWTLTCEDDAGNVYDSQPVTIWRGEVQPFDLACGAPAPPASAPPAPTTVAQAESLALVDRFAPTSAISRRLRATRARVSLRGTATDAAPAGLTPRIAQVRVAIGRRVGSRCRFLTADGTFGAPTSCKRTRYVVVHVKSPGRSVRWSYTLGARMPRGRYLAWSRALDAAGNIERKAKPRNLARFTIR